MFRFASDKERGRGNRKGDSEEGRRESEMAALYWPIEGAAKDFEKQILGAKNEVQDLTNVGSQRRRLSLCAGSCLSDGERKLTLRLYRYLSSTLYKNTSFINQPHESGKAGNTGIEAIKALDCCSLRQRWGGDGGEQGYFQHMSSFWIPEASGLLQS